MLEEELAGKKDIDLRVAIYFGGEWTDVRRGNGRGLCVGGVSVSFAPRLSGGTGAECFSFQTSVA